MSTFFQGKVVIVTGSSNGIGEEIARQFAEKGAKVTITGRRIEGIKKTRELCLSSGAKSEDLVEVVGDVTDDDALRRIVDETVKAFGQIDVLVNNAGARLPETPDFADQSIDALDESIAINTKSAIRLSQLAAPHLSKTRGSIVNISSCAAKPFVRKTGLFYGIAKAALDQATVLLAGTYSKQGIRVNSVNPGLIRSDFQRRVGADEDTLQKTYDIFKNTLAGRIGEPDDIAKIVLFIADRSQSEFIVGQCISADGGVSLENKYM